MTTIEYASELEPLLDLSLPQDWLVAIVPEPGQLLTEPGLPEDRLFAQLLSDGDGERIVATRLGFLYYRGVGPNRETSPCDNQISVRCDFPTAQYELSSVLGETTVQSPDAAATWVADQFLAVETFVDTYMVLIDLAKDIHGLGRTGVRGLVETFETVGNGALATVRWYDGEPIGDGHLQGQFAALKDVVSDMLDKGVFTPSTARQYLKQKLAERVGDRQDLLIPTEESPFEKASLNRS